MNYKFLVVSADETMIKCSVELCRSHNQQQLRTYIHYTSVVCLYSACACECLAAPSRPLPVSRLFHAGCTSS